MLAPSRDSGRGLSVQRPRGRMAPRVVRALALVAVVPAVVAAVQKVCDALRFGHRHARPARRQIEDVAPEGKPSSFGCSRSKETGVLTRDGTRDDDPC